MKNLILLSCVVGLVGCVSANIHEDSVCDSTSLGSVPASPVAGVALPPTSFSVSHDFSQELSKVSDVADGLTATVYRLSMDGDSDLGWLTSVDVSVNGGTSDTPDAPLAHYVATGDPGNSVNLQVDMDSQTMLRYLSHPVMLTFTLSGGAPTQTVNFQNTMCMSLDGNVNKSL